MVDDDNFVCLLGVEGATVVFVPVAGGFCSGEGAVVVVAGGGGGGYGEVGSVGEGCTYG